jgi:Ca2+-binding RTX toxin-like protein
MRKMAIMFGVVMVALFVASGVALAATITGTDKDETLIGTGYADTIKARGGDDEVRGLRGPDRLYGNGGKDEVVGGYGEDKLYGGNGNDLLRSQDIFSQSGAYRDVVDCGPGNDSARADFRDRVNKDNCEDVVVAIP